MKRKSFTLLKYIVCLFFFALVQFRIYCQSDQDFENLYFNTPEVANFNAITHFNKPIFDGSIPINIPLYEIETREINVNIGLAYNTKGIKLRSAASRVGTNWELMAGGRITRQINGTYRDFFYQETIQGQVLTDFYEYGWQQHNNDVLEAYNYDIIEESHIFDLEPDVYYIDAPGINSSFIIDKNQQAFVLSGDNIKLKSITLGNIVGGTITFDGKTFNSDIINEILTFKVVSDKGIEYTFSQCETNISNSTRTIGQSYGFLLMGEHYVATGWYLTQIKDTFGETITFTYDEKGERYITHYATSYFDREYTYDRYWYKNIYTYLNSNVRLKEIEWNAGSLIFDYNSIRRDIPDIDSALTEISLLDKDLNVIKTFNFDYDYWVDLGSIKIQPERLFLTSIETIGGLESVQYSFDYYNGIIPIPSSLEYDFLGYYNNNDATDYTTKTYAYIGQELRETQFLPFKKSSSLADEYVVFEGANRLPNLESAKIGMLKSIEYPTGGKIELDYALNTIYYGGEGLDYPGLRVSTQKIVDGNEEILKSYSYYAANYYLPLFGRLMVDPGLDILNPRTHEQKRSFIQDNHALFKNCLNNIDYYNGGSIGYGMVTEEIAGNGSVEYYFSTTSDENSIISSDGAGGSCHLLNPPYPYFKLTSNLESRGLLRETWNKDINDRYVKGEVYDWQFAFYKTDFLIGVNKSMTASECYFCERYVSHLSNTISTRDDELISTYTLKSGKSLPFRKYTFEGLLNDEGIQIGNSLYDIDNGGPLITQEGIIVTKEFYEYNWLLQLKSKSVFGENGKEYLTKYTYPSDVLYQNNVQSRNTEFAAISLLNENFNIGTPINTIKKIINHPSTDEKTIEGTLTTYTTQNNIAVPLNQYQIEIGSPSTVTEVYTWHNNIQNQTIPQEYKLKKKFGFTNTGNLSQIDNTDNIKKAYLWGYNNTLPIAKATNATSSQIAYTSFNEYYEGNWTYSIGTIITNQAEAKAGNTYLQMSGSNNISKSLTPGKYRLEYWAKSSAPAINGASVTDIYTSAADAKGWINYVKEINATSNTTVYLSGSGYIDELRIYPSNAQMTTYTYKPLVGMTSQTDENNITTYYEYDSFGRLLRILDQDLKVLQQFEYKYAQ